MTNIQYILFDLDDTLYAGASPLFKEVRRNIQHWLHQRLDISLEAASALAHEYYTAYGTTMIGLLRHHPHVDIDDYLAAVHRVDVTQYLSPHPELAAMLRRIEVRKAIFTNGITVWAERILTQLDVRPHFEHIIDVRAVGYQGKPYPAAYEKALDILGTTGDACIFIEDQPRNLQAAAAFGMRTILVRRDATPEEKESVEFAVDHILETEPILQRLLHNGSVDSGPNQ
ncbi:MAG: pyrimidine 5'-nucleotidase [Anaerolineales bacterium]